MARLNATEEELTYYVIDDRRAIRSPWGRGNSKIGPGIYTYSRLPSRHGVGTCPGSTDLCESVCYSKRFRNNSPLWEWMRENTYRGANLPRLPNDAKVVRVHVSGDFDTKEYIEAWGDLCSLNPRVLFFAYTRSWRVPSLLPSLELLKAHPNVQLFASMDVSTVEVPPQGWRCAWLGSLPEGVKALPCPEDAGEKDNCEVCGYCFRGKRGDVLFPIHGEPAKEARP